MASEKSAARRTVKVVADASELAMAGATTFVASCRLAPEGQTVIVGLAGGNTPRAMHTLLAAPEHRGQVRWDRVTLVFGDERCVPPDHPDSNYGMARKTLIAPLGLKDSQVLRMRGEAGAQAGAAEYEKSLASLGRQGPDGLPVIDLLFLGLGDDGHTASLFPGTSAVRETSRWVVPGYNAEVKSERITLSPLAINAAKLVVFCVSGARKAAVLQRVLEVDGPVDEHPARVVKPRDGHVLWLVDREAAALLAPETLAA